LSDPRRAHAALLRPSRVRAYAAAQFVGQESFMQADEILDLARRAGIGAGTRVLDLCCGMAGPGNHIARSLGSRHVGVDRSAEAVELAQEGAAGLPCRYIQGDVLDVRGERFEVVLLLETILAFKDKARLLRHIRGLLEPGGRFAFTYEEGEPLGQREREQMPQADTVQLVPRAEMEHLLTEAGFLGEWWCEEQTADHLEVARSLTREFRRERATLPVALAEELIQSHELWVDWLSCGRVRKFAVVCSVASGDGSQ
jgi:sarcosine/dimethylglycine N-methyltransferase